MAGQVRAKGEARRTRSDFMQMEQDRGISVSASAMSFDFGNYRFNLVDTPGHSDFSEDTYRTLTAVDAAIMVIDGAKGVESQTQKLFEVCRLRDLPILTFCNKMDRESRDTFEIIDEIQENLAIDVTPASWPIGMGRDFLGCYDLLHDRLELMDRADRNKVAESVKIDGLDDPKLAEHVPAALLDQLREEVEMARELLPALDKQAFHGGHADADLVRQRDQLLRGEGTDGRHRRIWPRAAGAERRAAPDRARGKEGRGLRLQGAGQHGPQAPRPGGLRPPRLGPFPARHEADPCALEEADGDLEPRPVPRLGPRTGRGGLGRRHHRHSEPRAASHRRHADRGRGAAVHRHPVLRAGASADLPGGRSR
jgi:small GTP-binding protein